jgi:hypothetical protein
MAEISGMFSVVNHSESLLYEKTPEPTVLLDNKAELGVIIKAVFIDSKVPEAVSSFIPPVVV